jgi:hypothetical protein
MLYVKLAPRHAGRPDGLDCKERGEGVSTRARREGGIGGGRPGGRAGHGTIDNLPAQPLVFCSK